MTISTEAQRSLDEIIQFSIEHEKQIHTESDARLQLIDRILIEVLGWGRAAIETEPHSPSGYADYVLTSGNRNLMVVEAKRTSTVIFSSKTTGLAYVNLNSPMLRGASEGIAQTTRYSSEKSVGFSIFTNGITWIGFRPVRLDGIPPQEGLAAVFPDLNSVKEKLAEFYELFSLEGVTQRLYSIYLDRQEGSKLSPIDPLVCAVEPHEIALMPRSDLGRDLEEVFNEFFRAITGEQDEELLLKCFVETAESKAADRSLEKITRDLVNSIQPIGTTTGSELKREIEGAFESGRGQITI
jgi:hypothetical protein